MGALPTLPNYNTQPVQVPDQVAQYARLQALRGQQQALQQQQAMAPLQLQQAQQGVQKGQIDIQDAQQAQAARQALNKAYSGAITTDATGQPTVDSNKLAAGLANTPGAYQTPAVMKGIEDFHKSRIETQTAATDLQSKQADLIGSAAAAVKAAGYDPTLAHSLLDSLPQSPQLQQIRSQIDNPQALKQIVDSAIQNSPKQRELTDTEGKDAQQVANQDQMRQQATDNAKQTQLNEDRAAAQRQQGISIEGARLKFDQQKQANDTGTTPTGSPSILATAIAHGQVTPDRMSYLLARNPQIIQGVLAVDPTFDGSKAQAYPATYKDFTSGKTSVALNAGGTALQHLNELKDMNTVESHIPGTADYNAYQNKADTVSTELARFYGTDTVPGIAAIKDTLTKNLPYQRAAAIQTQAQSMGDKLDSYQQTWQNAAPSKSYEAPMPGISANAMKARAALDPNYKATPQGGAAPQQGAPAGATHTVPGSDGKMHYTDGKNDLGVVQ